MRRHAVSASFLLLGFGLLAGCGQKGPLTLPPKPGTSAPAAPAHHHKKHHAAKPAIPATTAPASGASSG
ncbi:MAG: LPS translocon maturation chaperone LptM [Rhodanobacteraceae bacterium]